MFSLNAPLPGAVRRVVESLRPSLAGFDTVRGTPTLVVKRFGRLAPARAGEVESDVRLALAGSPAVEARIDGIETFERPISGPGPVVYLAVESPGIRRLHERLVDAFGGIDGLEGDDYVPHVTLARGGDRDAIDRLDADEVEPVTWTISELWFWDARRGERVGRVSLRA